MKAHLRSSERARVHKTVPAFPFSFCPVVTTSCLPPCPPQLHTLSSTLANKEGFHATRYTREALLYKGGEMEYRCMRIISGSQEALIGWIDCWLLNCGYLLTLAFIGDSNWSLQCADAVQMCLFTRTLCMCGCGCYIQGLLCKRSTCNEYLYFFI